MMEDIDITTVKTIIEKNGVEIYRFKVLDSNIITVINIPNRGMLGLTSLYDEMLVIKFEMDNDIESLRNNISGIPPTSLDNSNVTKLRIARSLAVKIYRQNLLKK